MTAGVLAEALVRWQHVAGPFWPYVCAAPFLGLGESEQLARQILRSGRVRGRPARGVSCRGAALMDQLLSGVDATPVLLVDLPAEPILALAPALAAQGWYVAPVIQRWIASPAVLPCRALMERLLLGAWQVRRPAAPRGAILIADGERTGPPGHPPLAPGRAFDNRYEYQVCRFPSTAFLAAQGVERVSWITADRPTAGGDDPLRQATLGIPPVARDLHPYREDLVRAGIRADVHLVDSVSWLPAR